MFKINKLRFTGLMLGSVMLLSGCSILPEEEVFETANIVKEYEQKEFSMVAVQRGDVCEFNRINCKYKESNTQEVNIGVWEVIKKIYVTEGDTVKKGDILLQFDDKGSNDDIEELEYQIKVTKAKINQAQDEKVLELKKQKLVLDDATAIKAIEERYSAEISGYQSDLELLNMKLEKAKADLEAFLVRAEMDGKVEEINSMLILNGGFDDWSEPEKHNMEEPKNCIMTISDETKPRFVGAVDPDNKNIQMKDGDKVKVICDDDTYTAKVKYRDSETVDFVLDERPSNLKDETIGYVMDIIEERKDVLYLPKSAISTMGEDSIVYKEDENGFKNPVKVQTGLTANNKTEIVSGLSEGDLIIVR